MRADTKHKYFRNRTNETLSLKLIHCTDINIIRLKSHVVMRDTNTEHFLCGPADWSSDPSETDINLDFLC